MTAPSWLKKYYGGDFEELSPEVIHEGKRLALVKLSRESQFGFSGIGFVLIEKNGNHLAGPHMSMHEGMPTPEKMEEMKKVLEQED